jgi:hypothetical protein
VQVTLIGPMLHLPPSLSATGFVPTKVSWLSRASDGCPVDPRKTKPGSPMPLVFGAGTGLALQSSCIGGELAGWIATPQVTFLPRAVHSCALDIELLDPSTAAPALGAASESATGPYPTVETTATRASSPHPATQGERRLRAVIGATLPGSAAANVQAGIRSRTPDAASLHFDRSRNIRSGSDRHLRGELRLNGSRPGRFTYIWRV